MPYITDVFPEDPADVFDVDLHWKEAMENRQPGGGESFTTRDGSAVIVVETTQNRIRSMIRKVLGFAYSDASNNGARLHRENPARHPWMPNLRAHSISFSAFPPDGANGLKVEGLPFAGAGKVVPYFARYQRVYATVQFKSFRFRFLDDSAIPNNKAEINRWVEWSPASSVQMLSAEGELGQCKWNETGAGPGPQPVVGEPIKQAFGTPVSKQLLVMRWLNVPHEWISTKAYPIPFFKKIFECVGKVNSAAFGPNDDFPAGTLLMQPPRYVPSMWQVLTADGLEDFMSWDVEVPLEYFDPPKGGASDLRGFRLLPWAGNAQWYHCVRASGGPFIPETDFRNIFEKANSP